MLRTVCVAGDHVCGSFAAEVRVMEAFLGVKCMESYDVYMEYGVSGSTIRLNAGW